MSNVRFVMVEMPVMLEDEADAFLRRISVCTSRDEVRELITKTSELYSQEPTGSRS